jgi:isopentenyl diphosphate isomerase/L-lactate dehydrogenase-like FMN-dependent dehydrogenase
MTTDNDVNISILERAKQMGASVIILTADNPITHQSYGVMENGADMTFQQNAFQNILHDPVFNIKCYQKHNCVGTKNSKYLEPVAKHLKKSVKKLQELYNQTKSLEFARDLQLIGMSRVNHVSNKTDKNYIYSVEHIASICHEKKSTCKYFKNKILNGVPLVIKGVITKEEATTVQRLGADGVYVSVHGGRFLYNAKPPIDIISDIRKSVKAVNKSFAIWFDGGIRNGQSILTAYANGAEFVGVGRPVIYSCVLYGASGVENIYRQYLYELAEMSKICGIQHLNQKKIENLLF